MDLSHKDLAKMERLLHLQKDLKDSGDIKESNTELTPRRGDWRKIEEMTFPLTTHLGDNVKKNRRKTDCRRQGLVEPEEV